MTRYALGMQPESFTFSNLRILIKGTGQQQQQQHQQEAAFQSTHSMAWKGMKRKGGSQLGAMCKCIKGHLHLPGICR